MGVAGILDFSRLFKVAGGRSAEAGGGGEFQRGGVLGHLAEEACGLQVMAGTDVATAQPVAGEPCIRGKNSGQARLENSLNGFHSSHNFKNSPLQADSVWL